MDVYAAVTDRILKQLESGTVPWVKPWSDTAYGSPHNAISGKAYRGINAWLLYAPPGGSGDGWLTYKQAQDVGAQVRRGEKGTMIVFFKPWTVTDRNDPESKERTVPVLRNFTVFHTSQVDGLPAKYLPVRPEPRPECECIGAAETLIRQAKLSHGGNRAYYRPATDEIQLPESGQFRSAQDYYATALHELTHWTGAKHRLDREYGKRFGDSAYAREELVAEMGAAFLCAHCGIDGQLQHAEYLAAWISVLKTDKRAVVMAAAAAQKAADFALGVRAAADGKRDGTTGEVQS